MQEHVLYQDEFVESVFIPPMVSYRSAIKLISYLVRAPISAAI